MHLRLLTYIKVVLITLFFISNYVPGISQTDEVQVDVLSVKHGLDGLEVDNFFIDRNKMIWLSTKNCLNLSSPTSVEKIFTGDGERNIHSSFVIGQIKEHELFTDIFYDGEVSFFDRYDSTTGKIKKVLIKPTITSLYRFIKVVKYGQDIFIVYQSKNDLKIHNIYDQSVLNIPLNRGLKFIDIIVHSDGLFLLSENQKVYQISGDSILHSIDILKPLNASSYKHDGKHIKQDIQIFHLDIEGNLWLSIKNYPGVFLMKKGEKSLRVFDKLPKDQLFTWVSEDDTGKVLFCSTERYRYTEGYYLLDRNNEVHKWNLLKRKFNLPRKIVSSDFYDEMYISTYRNLLILNFKSHDFLSSYFVNEKVKNEHGAYGNLLWGIEEVEDGRIFVTSEKPGWGFLDIEETDFFTAESKLDIFENIYDFENEVHYAIANIKNSKYKLQLIQIFPDRNDYSLFPDSISVFSVVKTKNEKILCGTSDGYGVFSLKYIDSKNQKLIGLREIPFKPSFMQYDDKTNRLWCVDRSKGLFVVNLNNPNDDIKIIVPKNINGLSYYGVNLGKANQIFISTNQGFFIYDYYQNEFTKHYSTVNGLSSNAVCAVVEDEHNNLWISTFSGLNFYNSKLNYFTQYWVDQGLPNDEFNTKTFLTDRNKNIYFGGANGLVKIDLEKFYNKKFKAYIKKWYIKDEFQDTDISGILDSPIKIHKDNSRRIILSSIHEDWKNKDNITYIVDVNSDNNHWRQIYKHNVIDFSYLSQGNYILEFTAVNMEGIPAKTISKKIIIYKNWYEESWFLTALLMFIGAIFVFGFLYFRNLQERETERRELNFEKRVSQLELGVLQAQMNPHFIFNSLNAIQSRLDDGDKSIVSQYLEDFAGLMRLFLESSRNNTLTLQNELKLISLYIKLESLRFGDKMKYDIIVDKDIDLLYTRIPTMLLQPFIENSINHGLFHKGHGGILRIEFQRKNDRLCISVIDNGIGRKKSLEIRNSSVKNYKSRALSIIHERIDILKKYNQYDIELEIKDLYDDDNIAQGTEVYISLPLRVSDNFL